MQSEVLGPVWAVKQGWKVFSRRPIFALVSAAVWLALALVIWVLWLNWGYGLNFFAINAVMCAIPIGIFLVIGVPIIGGVMTSSLAAARGSRPTLANYLAALKRCDKWQRMGGRAVGATMLMYIFIGMVTSLAGGGLAVEGMSWMRLHLTVAGALVLAMTLFTRFPFGWFALAEARSPSEAIRSCAAAARGRALRAFASAFEMAFVTPALIALGIVVWRENANAFGAAGWVAFWVGAVFFTAIALNSMAAIYVHLAPTTEQDAAMDKAA